MAIRILGPLDTKTLVVAVARGQMADELLTWIRLARLSELLLLAVEVESLLSESLL